MVKAFKSSKQNTTMSIIHCLIIKGNKIHYAPLHYRSALKLVRSLAWDRKKAKRTTYLDAGYMVIDYNQKLIIDCQIAFSPHEEVREDWELLTLW